MGSTDRGGAMLQPVTSAIKIRSKAKLAVSTHADGGLHRSRSTRNNVPCEAV